MFSWPIIEYFLRLRYIAVYNYWADIIGFNLKSLAIFEIKQKFSFVKAFRDVAKNSERPSGLEI